MAAPIVTHVERQPWGTVRRDVRLHAWIRHPDGRVQARVAYDERIGDDVHEIRFLADRDDLVEKPGVDYGQVPVEQVAPGRGRYARYERRAG